jgi:protein-tyrosine phosphatase
MIDIHTHILHGLDDGAKTLDDSLAMLRIAGESGTTDIVGTPHASVEFAFDPELTRKRVAELSVAAGPGVRVHSGCDFHFKYDNIADALENPSKYTVNNKRYLLIEVSDLVIFKSTESDFERLQAAGMLLVITHPERNPLLQQRLEQLRRWVDMGCYLQVTGDSFFGRWGRKAKEFADELMKQDLVHFVASDAHGSHDRTPTLKPAFDYVAKKYGEKRAAHLFAINPGAALTGDPLVKTEVAPPAKKKWYAFWS